MSARANMMMGVSAAAMAMGMGATRPNPRPFELGEIESLVSSIGNLVTWGEPCGPDCHCAKRVAQAEESGVVIGVDGLSTPILEGLRVRSAASRGVERLKEMIGAKPAVMPSTVPGATNRCADPRAMAFAS